MSKRRSHWTQKRPDGKWESKREGAQRASKVTRTQAEAWDHTRAKAKKAGGEAFLKNKKGRIRLRNTYGSDPYPPKG